MSTPRTAAGPSDIERVQLAAIRWRARDNNDGKVMAQGDRSWLLRYIERRAIEDQAAAPDALREALERLVEAQNTLDRAVTDEQMVAAVNGLEPAMKQARAALAAEPAGAGLHKHKFGPTRVPASVGVRLCLTCGAPEAATPVGEEAG